MWYPRPAADEPSTATVPTHVAIIMDGNGRWAKERQQPRLWGHKHGVERVREAVTAAAEFGVRYLTLYAFSEENWQRPSTEVRGLLRLLDTFLVRERGELQRQNVALRVIGALDALPAATRSEIAETTARLRDNTGLQLTIALSYGARSEITHACQEIARAVAAGRLDPATITQDTVATHLWTHGLPDPDLLIRTSGEQRISNFLLWQLAYCEFYFSPLYWPDFGRAEFAAAMAAFHQRQRRFGRTAAAPPLPQHPPPATAVPPAPH